VQASISTRRVKALQDLSSVIDKELKKTRTHNMRAKFLKRYYRTIVSSRTVSN